VPPGTRAAALGGTVMAHMTGPRELWWFFLIAVALFGAHCGIRCLRGRCGTPDGRDQHASHALMAVGMVYMLGPVTGGAGVRVLGQVAFWAVAAYFTWSGLRQWRRDRRGLDALASAHHAVTGLAMVYMLGMPEVSLLLLSTVLIAYFTASVFIDGGLLAQGVSVRVMRDPLAAITQGGRMVMAAGMVYMLAVMDDLSRSGGHHHHPG
jgi:Domain of unknown function (DUF5134)